MRYKASGTIEDIVRYDIYSGFIGALGYIARMPELPEVEVVRQGLEPLLCGQVIEEIDCFRDGLRYPFPDFSQLLGCRFHSVKRRAKYLLFDSDASSLLVWHLGMTGQFQVLPQSIKPAKHEHVRFLLSNGQALCYRDPRRFGYAGLLPKLGWQQTPWFARLGVEPLSDAFHADAFYALIHVRKAPIKQVLMDAHIVVGVGNIYASESLFRARISPLLKAHQLSKKRAAILVAIVKDVLAEAVAAGGSSISDFVHVDGKPGYFAHDFQVYGRAGEPCRKCNKPIRKIVQAGRSSFYCTHCQSS